MSSDHEDPFISGFIGESFDKAWREMDGFRYASDGVLGQSKSDYSPEWWHFFNIRKDTHLMHWFKRESLYFVDVYGGRYCVMAYSEDDAIRQVEGAIRWMVFFGRSGSNEEETSQEVQ